ncbi:sugar transferase [Brachybacterium sp. Marseille-Q7125]|uniref:sugar transferase n=1 Tax=Brachybacterium sp. Marseille-Q7125 TaxID=2932815 RepID=UPI00248BFB18|nr:sugar transferase [Brachybacterium sp. Marseille-Q7125]
MSFLRSSAAKRCADVAASAVGLLITSPVMLAASVAVLATDGRPVLFRQERVGKGGRPFTILKFRSMRNDQAGIQVSSDRDPRITRVGAVLRKTKIDELPQLVNVLRGEMSIVGPRPEVPRYVAQWPTELRPLILSVRPGITDPASIAFRHESEILAGSEDPETTYVKEILPQKAQMYAQYVRTQNLREDLSIVCETVKAVVRG